MGQIHKQQHSRFTTNANVKANMAWLGFAQTAKTATL